MEEDGLMAWMESPATRFELSVRNGTLLPPSRSEAMLLSVSGPEKAGI